MLAITVPAVDSFDETTSKFIEFEEVTIQLEHSLASLSKWEAIHEKAFLGPDPHTRQQVLDYVECMCVTPNVDPSVFRRLSAENFDTINAYINRKMSATWFTESKQSGRGREVVTAEVVYFWMAHYGIPFEAEHWHFNRLMTLVRVANAKNDTGKKKQSHTTKGEMLRQRRAMNEQRRLQHNTTG